LFPERVAHEDRTLRSQVRTMRDEICFMRILAVTVVAIALFASRLLALMFT
jgi:hypothetical protein